MTQTFFGHSICHCCPRRLGLRINGQMILLNINYKYFIMYTVEDFFKSFLSDIQLTSTQRADAQTKYQGVINCLSNHFYNRARQDKDQFLFGSYKTKTNIRPLDNGSDVDVLFKISSDCYNRYKNNPSGLLQEIRNALKCTYTTTDEIKAWGKVVLVKFSDGHHNVELLPALENANGTFTSPSLRYGNYTIQEITAPTATSDGIRQYTCTVCGSTKLEVIPRSGENEEKYV